MRSAPDPYRGPNGGEVVVERILAWTISADGALVVATADDREGLYLLDTTPGGDRVPRYVGILREPVFATAAFDGSLSWPMQGRLLAWTEGRLVEIDLPSGVPAALRPHRVDARLGILAAWTSRSWEPAGSARRSPSSCSAPATS